MNSEQKQGIVYLVGAGPGDPGLITLRGVECLCRAEVVVYDYLANEQLLNFAPDGAERIYAGKIGGRHNQDQAEINRILVDKAEAGKTVVRLKGGDPFVFGRGGEECEALAEAGIAFQVVPGVTAGVGAAAGRSSSGTCSRPSPPSSAARAMRSTTFWNSRMLPGQG